MGHLSEADLLKEITRRRGRWATLATAAWWVRHLVTAAPDSTPSPAPKQPRAKSTKPKRPRLDWTSLHQHTFGTDVLCPCGGRRTIKALFSTHKAAEERLVALGLRPPSRLLPSATAPPQLTLAV